MEANEQQRGEIWTDGAARWFRVLEVPRHENGSRHVVFCDVKDRKDTRVLEVSDFAMRFTHPTCSIWRTESMEATAHLQRRDRLERWASSVEGHWPNGVSMDDMSRLIVLVDEMIDEEREACARLLEEQRPADDAQQCDTLDLAARSVRARGRFDE